MIDGYVFWDQNFCIVLDAYSPISLTGIDKIKHLSIIYIYILVPIINIYYSSSKQIMAQSRSYSCHKLTMRHAEWDVLDLINKFLQSSNEN
jgi:hypothetical protein